MTGIKEIRDHIKSVEQTLKITNAMYLISSANLRRARKQLSDVLPYFTKIHSTITDILCRSPELQHPFFDRRGEIPAEERKTALIIITGDKGLAGSYNHNVLQLAGRHLQHMKNPRLFVQGQVGRVHFSEAGFSLEKLSHSRHFTFKCLSLDMFRHLVEISIKTDTQYSALLFYLGI